MELPALRSDKTFVQHLIKDCGGQILAAADPAFYEDPVMRAAAGLPALTEVDEQALNLIKIAHHGPGCGCDSCRTRPCPK